MPRVFSFKALLISGCLSAALIAAPAQAHHGHGTDVIVPLAALITFGALYHHGHHQHRHSTHRHYYRSYKRHHYNHGHNRYHGHSISVVPTVTADTIVTNINWGQ